MSQERKFGLTVGTAFLLLGALLLWRDKMMAARVIGIVGGSLVVAGVLVPSLLRPVERAWMTMAHAISKVTTPIFMGIVYYLSVVPIGLALRILGKNPLNSKSKTTESYWVDRKTSLETGDLTRQF